MRKKSFLSKILSVFLMGVSLTFSSCMDKTIETLIIKNNGEVIRITDDTTFYQNVIIESGVVFELSDSVSMIFNGNLTAIGEKNSRIVFKPANTSWDFIEVTGKQSNVDLSYVSVINGKIKIKEKTSIKLDHVAFQNTAKQNYWDGLLVLANGGAFYGDSVTMISNFKGEGIILNVMDSVHIQNSSFTNVNDAFEILICNYAMIENCSFNGTTYDDAIDLNGCRNVVIQNNTFTRVNDRCIEIGANEYFQKLSTNIVIVNNLFEKSRIGIESKEGSEIYAGLNTFSKCKYAVEIDNHASSLINYNSFVIEIDSSVVFTDKNSSEVIWKYSVSDVALNLNVRSTRDPYKAINPFTNIVNIDSSVFGYRLSNPVDFKIDRINELK